MTDEMLRTVVEVAGAKFDEQGVAAMAERQTLTLYLAHDGATLSVGRVVRLALRGHVLKAEDDQGEVFVLALEDAFAASIAGPSGSSSRKAGFLR